MFDALAQIFASEFARRALFGCLLIGFTNGLFSAFVLLRKSALQVGSLSHALLPGIATAILFSGLTAWSALLGGLFAALFVGLGSLLLSRISRLEEGTALAILYTTAFAGGLLILQRLPMNVELEHYLFGNIALLSDFDLKTNFVIATVTVACVCLLQRPLLLMLFDPQVAAAQGVPVKALAYLLFALLILVLVASLQAVGCILSLGLLVTPAATLYLLTNDFRILVWGGALLGAIGSAAAFILAWVTNLPQGATIVLVLGGLFLLALLFSPRYGLLRLILRPPTPQNVG